MDSPRMVYAVPSGHGRASIIVRPWQSLKYEAAYGHESCDGFEVERVIAA